MSMRVLRRRSSRSRASQVECWDRAASAVLAAWLALVLIACAPAGGSPPAVDAGHADARGVGASDSGSGDSGSLDSGSVDSGLLDAPASGGGCDAPTELLDVRSSSESGPPSCREWIDRVRGRVVANSSGSAVVWTRDVASGLGVVLSAVHVLGSGWFHAGGTSPGDDIAERLGIPRGDAVGVMRLEVPPADGRFMRGPLSPLWVIYNPAIPAAEHDNTLLIRPARDFVVALTDDHRVLGPGMLPPSPVSFSERQRISLYDPASLAVGEPRFVDPTPGALALLVGYPQAGPEHGSMAVGRILSDEEARDAIAWLASEGDEEGSIPYDPTIEALIEGRAVAGMSGGGGFDREGRLIGILVRASDPTRARQIVRLCARA